MTWATVAMAALNVVQVVALAWIAMREAEVKRELKRTNGSVTHALRTISAKLDGQRSSTQPQ